MYLNSMEYIKENSEIIVILYNILINNDAINTVTHTLGILILICDYLKEEGVEMIIAAAEQYSKRHNSHLLKELVMMLGDANLDIQVNTMTLISLLVKYITEKNTRARIVVALQTADFQRIVERNSDCKSQDFQTQLTNYQKITGEIVRGSNYEIEIYKKKLKDLEKHCQDLENKVEFVFLNQKFYDEIVDDFIHFKKLSEVCSDMGGYYDPCKIELVT